MGVHESKFAVSLPPCRPSFSLLSSQAARWWLKPWEVKGDKRSHQLSFTSLINPPKPSPHRHWSISPFKDSGKHFTQTMHRWIVASDQSSSVPYRFPLVVFYAAMHRPKKWAPLCEFKVCARISVLHNCLGNIHLCFMLKCDVAQESKCKCMIVQRDGNHKF